LERCALHTLVVQGRATGGVDELAKPSVGVVIKVVCVLEYVPRDTGTLVVLAGSLPLEGIAVDAVGLASRGLVVVDVGVAALVRLLGGTRDID
jgi:hypothetical protein